jgi:hypothetical protein
MPRRARQCVKRQRPLWWTPEGVVERLQSGRYIHDLCREAAAEMAEIGIEIAPVTLRAEVARWCETASWGDQLRAGLALWKKSSSGAIALAKHWHDDFIAAMEVTKGNAKKAAELAGVGYGVVLACLDKRNRCYDPDFHERFRIAEAGRIGELRESYMELAETGDDKLAFRAKERLIEAALPGLHSPKQEVVVSGKVDHEHDHQHVHGIAPGLAREVVLASQARTKALLSNRVGLLPADPTDLAIDITPAPAKQEETASRG